MIMTTFLVSSRGEVSIRLLFAATFENTWRTSKILVGWNKKPAVSHILKREKRVRRQIVFQLPRKFWRNAWQLQQSLQISWRKHRTKKWLTKICQEQIMSKQFIFCLWKYGRLSQQVGKADIMHAGFSIKLLCCFTWHFLMRKHVQLYVLNAECNNSWKTVPRIQQLKVRECDLCVTLSKSLC